MSQITADILAKVAPHTPHALRDRFIPYFNECLPQYEITTKERVSAFLTTVCFESDYFKALSEYASGWAYDISQNPKKARELGNTVKGDGPRYKGAGGIETTGKKNYKRLSDRLGVDFVANPGLLRTEKYFVVAACVFWDDNNFNDLADDDEITRIENITNRGSGNKTAKALDDRLAIYRILMAFLPDDFELSTAQAPNQTASSTASVENNTDQPATSQPIEAVPSNGLEIPTQTTVEQTTVADETGTATATKVTSTTAEPVTVKSIALSLETKVVAAFGALTALGINGGTLIENRLSDITLNQLILIGISVGLIIVVIWFIKVRKGANDAKDIALIQTAANKDQNTVVLEK